MPAMSSPHLCSLTVHWTPGHHVGLELRKGALVLTILRGVADTQAGRPFVYFKRLHHLLGRVSHVYSSHQPSLTGLISFMDH